MFDLDFRLVEWRWRTFFHLALLVAMFAAATPLFAQQGSDTLETEGEASDELPPLSVEAEQAVAELREKLEPESEAARMLDSILLGNQLGPTDGWFEVSKTVSRYDWEFARQTWDQNADLRIEESEFTGAPSDFSLLDRNRDRLLTESDYRWASQSGGPVVQRLVGGLDRDENGILTTQELAGLAGILAASGRDSVSLDEFRQLLLPPESPREYQGDDVPDRSTLVLGLYRQEIGALSAGLALEELAPDFSLATLSGEEVQLSELIGEKPVVLVFGNFTCGPFRSQAGNLERLYRTFQDRVNFLLVYVREAHPSDGWWMLSNDRIGISIKQPESMEERSQVAVYCQQHLNFEITMVIDEMDDPVGGTYSGMPSRLYLIDESGRVAFKSGRGPFGFMPAELETALLTHLAVKAEANE